MRAVAVDIGGSRVRAALVESREVVRSVAAPTPGRLDELPPLVARMVVEVSGDEQPAALGVACAGLVDAEQGQVRWVPHMAGKDLPIGTALQERLGGRVVVDNDANLATLAEATAGAGGDARMVLGVVVGTGIGTGLVIEGRIERGRAFLGEAGHMTVASGPRCVCGRYGCWEEKVSGRVLDREARRLAASGDQALLTLAGDQEPSGAHLVAAAEQGHEEAGGAVADAGRWLGVGLANLITILDPDVIVVGGIAAAPDGGLSKAAEQYLREQEGGIAAGGVPDILPAHFGAEAGLIGAAIATEASQ